MNMQEQTVDCPRCFGMIHLYYMMEMCELCRFTKVCVMKSLAFVGGKVSEDES